MNKIQIFVDSLKVKPFIRSLINDLNADVYAVGGVVRDLILSKQNKDIDLIIRKIPIDLLISHLQKFGKVDVVGKSFGVIKFIDVDGLDYDLALPRKEKPNGEGGYQGFDVQSDENLSIIDDLIRRDAKFNAMAININNGQFIDPLDGLNDIENRQISAANLDAFSDDPLRMLRMVSFSTRFGFVIEPKTMKLIQKNANRITEIPFDRVLTEFGKIVEKGNPLIGAKLLQSTGLYGYVFGKTPRLSFVGRPFDRVKTLGEFVFLLIYGVWDDPSEYFKKTMKGDNDSYNEMRSYKLAYDSVINKNLSTGALRSLAHNMFVTSQYSITSGIITGELAKACQDLSSGRYPKTVNDLTVRGNDLMQMGLKGKEIGDLQKKILSDIYFDKIRNDRDSILSGIDQTKSIENEGVGDKYAEKAFGIPDQDVVFDKYFNASKPNNLGEPSAYIKARVGYDDGYSEKVDIPLYVNPKTLNSFDSEVRAIVDQNGDIYIAFIDGYFDHGEMAEALNLDVGGYSRYNIYNHPQKYVLLVRIGKTNTFGFSDTSSENYINYMYEIDALLEKAKLKNPQFIFDKRYYGDIGKLISENDEDKSIEYGCLMLFLDVPIWNKITSIIKHDDLHEKGLEEESHVTILYGFNDEVTSDEVFSLYNEKYSLKPLEIKISGISIFENPEFDVVKFDVNSEILVEVNKMMRTLPNTQTFPDYHPHITIAYVKSGCGKNYIKKFEKERILIGNELVYTWKGHKGKEGGDILKLDAKKLNESNEPIESKYVNTKEQLMNSKSISTEMKEKISEYLTSNSEYIMGGRVLGLSQPSGFTNKTPKSSGVSLGADKNGFYCYTHRASSKRYKTPEKIPVSAIEFIESTG